jgi:hypothetical protein
VTNADESAALRLRDYLELVWKTVERDIPELEIQVLQLRNATNE